MTAAAGVEAWVVREGRLAKKRHFLPVQSTCAWTQSDSVDIHSAGGGETKLVDIYRLTECIELPLGEEGREGQNIDIKCLLGATILI